MHHGKAAMMAIGDTFIMMVRDSPAVETAITGTDGLLECVAPGKLVIDMGSTNLDVTRRMAEAIKAKGGDYLDAPYRVERSAPSLEV